MSDSKKPFISLVVGARPNFVKAAPLMNVIRDEGRFHVQLVHTGQHYDYSMSKSFFDLFSIQEPDFNLEVGSGLHGEQTGRVLIEYEKLLIRKRPDLVVVLGDVNSTLAAALAAAKLHVPVAHIEAGLRSFDKDMPEEVNRILTDHLSDLLFVTEDSGVSNLLNEGVSEKRIHLSGNVMIDALRSIEPLIDSSSVLQALGLNHKRYSVATLHRPSNVDTSENLSRCYEMLVMAAEFSKVVFPMHPRTLKSIRNEGMEGQFRSLDGLLIIEPQGYADFMALVRHALFVMTDSGGIQSEASYLKTPCITLRNSTEHLLTLSHGTNTLTGFKRESVRLAMEKAMKFDDTAYSAPSLLDGRAAQRILNAMNEFLK